MKPNIIFKDFDEYNETIKYTIETHCIKSN